MTAARDRARLRRRRRRSAIVTGIALAKSLLIERVLSPYIVAAQAIPILALAPLLDIWFGGGLSARVVICALIVFFPIAIATMVGIRSTDPLLDEMLRSLGANPRAANAAARDSVGPAGDLRRPAGRRHARRHRRGRRRVGRRRRPGLGVLINIANQGLFDTPLMFVALATLAIIGLVFYGGVVVRRAAARQPVKGRPMLRFRASHPLALAGGLLAGCLYLRRPDRQRASVTQTPQLRAVTLLLGFRPGRAVRAVLRRPAGGLLRRCRPRGDDRAQARRPTSSAWWPTAMPSSAWRTRPT